MSADGNGGVRAVLFDLDGVLVDSYEAWFAVVNDAASLFSARAVDRERFRSVWGQGISADVKHLYPGRTHREVEAAYEESMGRHGAAIRVNPEALAALDGLRARGIARACVTNTQIGLAQAVLRGAGFQDRFESVQGMSEGRREKPAPDLLLAALDAVSAPPSCAVMVGDSRYDEEASAAAGVPFLSYDLKTGASLLAALDRAVGRAVGRGR